MVEIFIQQFGATLGTLTLYPASHRAVQPSREALFSKLHDVLAGRSPLTVVSSPQQLLLDGTWPLMTNTMSERVREFLRRLGISILSFQSSLTREVFRDFMDFLLAANQRLKQEDLPLEDRYPGAALSLTDYSQVLTPSAAEETTSPEKSVWEVLVSDFFSRDQEEFSEKELLGMVTLMEQEVLFAREVTAAIGLSPDAGSITRLGALLDAAHEFLVRKLDVPREEALVKLKKCLLALPEEIQVPLMETTLSAGAGGDAREPGTVEELVRHFTMNEVVTSLASVFEVGTKAFSRMANVLRILSPDDEAKQSLLPMLRQTIEQKSGRGLSQIQWQQIQNFLSPSSDRFVSDTYGRLLNEQTSSAQEETAVAEEDAVEKENFLVAMAEQELSETSFWVLMENFLSTEDPALARSLAAELTRGVDSHLASGRYAQAEAAISFLREAGQRTGESSGHDRTAEIEAILQELLTEERLAAVVGEIKQIKAGELAHVKIILQSAPKAAAKILIGRLAEEEDRSARRFLVTTLIELGAFSKAEALKMLHDGRWYVVRNMISILGEVGDAETVPRLVPFLAHRDRRMRKEATQALIAIGSYNAQLALLQVLDDPDEDIAQQVTLFLASTAEPARLSRHLLKQVVQSDPFGRRDTRVKRVILALGKIRSHEAVPYLRKLLTKRRWFVSGSKRYSLSLAAAAALANIDTPEAELALQHGANGRKGPVPRACRQFIEKKKARTE